MNIAVCLLLYSLTILVAGPSILRMLTRHGHAPRFGVAAWLVAIGTVLLSWLAAAGIFLVKLASNWSYPRVLVESCVALFFVMVNDSAGVALITLGLIAAALALLAAVTGVRLARTVARMRARAHAHAAAVRLVGHHKGNAYVMVEAAEPAAYCVSGRPPAIVVTSAALAALDDHELAAVLAHERAHLNGHHSVVVTTLRGLAAVFPKLTLMREGASEVSRLLEMCADDASARQHGPAVLLSGLITMCRAAPAGALAAADVAVLARAERLATPPGDPAVARARAALISLIAVMVAAPIMTAALAALGVLMCAI
ncbi:M56 family metallopeptidase [Mycobacterium asiaticum]|uniref:M56 family metallopeptidase n=1 Tax=Mycobacterium asiaticum TaxID=1790 RepID=UPI0007F03FE7|nr:M56 family metallopeptidase [Mycobacterium asiaticum]OBI98738.1 peptidase M48 [Mycobacterium asiaticum]